MVPADTLSRPGTPWSVTGRWHTRGGSRGRGPADCRGGVHRAGARTGSARGAPARDPAPTASHGWPPPAGDTTGVRPEGVGRALRRVGVPAAVHRLNRRLHSPASVTGQPGAASLLRGRVRQRSGCAVRCCCRSAGCLNFPVRQRGRLWGAAGGVAGWSRSPRRAPISGWAVRCARLHHVRENEARPGRGAAW